MLILKAGLIRDEGMRLLPYIDTVGKTTIGVGRNLTDNGITEIEAHRMLEHDINNAHADLIEYFPWVKDLDSARLRALVNMSFNLGMPRLAMFKRMMGYLGEQMWAAAADEALDSKWARQVGARATRIATEFRYGGERSDE